MTAIPLSHGRQCLKALPRPNEAVRKVHGSGWRVGIVVAAVVTTYSTATGAVRFSTFGGQLTTFSREGRNSAAFKIELEDNPTLQHQQNTARVGGNLQVQSLSDLAFIASNAYTRRGDKIGLGYPWLEGRILVEPYRDTMLEVISREHGALIDYS